jgi:hypothetical protein
MSGTSQALQHDIGAWITSRFADQIDVTAAGAGDATESDGIWVQRPEMAASCKVIVAYEAVLADTEDIAIGFNVQDATSAAGAGVDDFGAAVASAVLVTSSGGTTERGVVELDLNLAGANEFLRTQITPDMSAASTDTARIQAVFVFSGERVVPAA